MADYNIEELLRRERRSPLQRIGQTMVGVGRAMRGKEYTPPKEERSPYEMLILRELLERGRPQTSQEKVADMDLADRERYRELHGLGEGEPGTRVPTTERPIRDASISEMFPGDTTLEGLAPTQEPEDIGLTSPNISDDVLAPFPAPDAPPPKKLKRNVLTPEGYKVEDYDNPKYEVWKRREDEKQDILKSKRTIQKEVGAKQAKDVLTAQQDLRNAQLKITGTLDNWFDMAERTQQLTGLPPGPIAGVMNKVLGATKANEYFEAFHGQLVEHAAAVGRIAIPGARATRLIRLFKTTAPTDFSTIESAGINAATSFRNAIATDMSREPWAWLPEYSDMPERSALAKWNKLDRFEQLEKVDALIGLAEGFKQNYVTSFFDTVYEKNPTLLREDYREAAKTRRMEQGAEEVIGATEEDPFGLDI